MKEKDSIIALLQTNKSEAFKAMYLQYYRMCLYFIKQNNGSEIEAQDIFQEIMLIIYEQFVIEDKSIECSIKTYIYSINRNLWLNKLKEMNKKVSIHEFEDFLEVNVDDRSIDLKQEDEKRFSILENSLKQLGEKCKQILQLFYYEKKSMELIAEQLNYTNALNAKNQKYKCLKQLKQKIDE